MVTARLVVVNQWNQRDASSTTDARKEPPGVTLSLSMKLLMSLICPPTAVINFHSQPALTTTVERNLAEL